MKREVLLLLMSLLIISSGAFATLPNLDGEMGLDQYDYSQLEAWDKYNNPFNFSDSYTYTYSQLHKSAKLPIMPWSDSYWPSYRGGIAVRWSGNYRNKHRSPLHYSLYSRRTLARYSEKRDQKKYRQRLDSMSPAEKYGVFVGDYKYSLWHQEKARTKKIIKKPKGRYWEGLCDGWAASAYLFDEPKPITVTNADGITVSFGSSDIKALLIYYMAKKGKSSHFLGKRNNKITIADIKKRPGLRFNPRYRDVNPGAFHVVLTNQIGFMLEGFVMDADPQSQVWNHPIYSYKTEELHNNLRPSASAARGTVREIRVRTTVHYAVEIGSYWDANKFGSKKKVYTYRLELDRAGRILGGEWEGKSTLDHPDFLWKMQRPSEFKGYFAGLNELYRRSLAH